MPSLKQIAVCVPLLAPLTSAHAAIPVHYPADATEQMKIRIDDAVALLKKSCTPLFSNYAEDVEFISGSLFEDAWIDKTNQPVCGSYRCDRYGWQSSVRLSVKISDAPTRLPNSVHAFGHTETYFVGGHPKPGFTLTKFPELCGAKPSSDGSDVFIEVK